MAYHQRQIYDSCNLLADYSSVDSTPILPYIIALNLTNSDLTPEAGANQRFCYDVTSVGEEGAAFADLTQLVLGVCEELTAEDIAGVTVIINGEEQEVDFGEGGNVILRTADDPDPISGNTGLAFYFELPREDSQMQLCFELTDPLPIGPNQVSVSGGGLTLDSLDVCGPVCQQPGEPVVAYYRANVCTPFRVMPYATPGTPIVTLCGEPEISLGNDCNRNDDDDDCGFTIRQQLCVTIPVTFGAEVEAGRSRSEGVAAGGEEVCEGCNGDDTEDGVITRRGCGA